MSNFERAVPTDDHRLITVNGLNMPEFPSDEELHYCYTGIPVIHALERWIDMTLASNQYAILLEETNDTWQIPETLWVPGQHRTPVVIECKIDVTYGEEQESLSYFNNESQTVATKTETITRSISQPPKQVSQSLDHLYLQRDVEITGDFTFRHIEGHTMSRIGNIVRQGGWNTTEYFNEKTGKYPNEATANRMAMATAKKILNIMGYNTESFNESSQTYEEYLSKRTIDVK